ncbi:hypothetical protein K469DRAFT_711895 [Zopfia rhizophila CBS 207.26]|uniref:Uncharacterized protein n=1 Tax=Zopfia rhizophila CBS 207.26 TaxID=1314779 RepID=A0A6A6DU87_9PEZI|nr:hypothetical protein K469DRAFT_711895 [Zopfia rhizophila CBS 207.26]
MASLVTLAHPAYVVCSFPSISIQRVFVGAELFSQAAAPIRMLTVDGCLGRENEGLDAEVREEKQKSTMQPTLVA